MIRYVYKFQNGMVFVFNRKGGQIFRYQGCYSDVKDKILKDAPKNTIFYAGTWGGAILPISREEF